MNTEVGSLSPAKHPLRIELLSSQFLLQPVSVPGESTWLETVILKTQKPTSIKIY